MEPLESVAASLNGLVGMFAFSIEHLCYDEKISRTKDLSSLLKKLIVELDEEIEQEELKHKQLIKL